MNLLILVLALSNAFNVSSIDIGDIFDKNLWQPEAKVITNTNNKIIVITSEYKRQSALKRCRVEIQYNVNNTEYIISINTNYVINYIETTDKRFSLPNGIRIGTLYTNIQSSIRKMVHSNTYLLSDDWYAITSNENNPVVKKLFKTQEYPVYSNNQIEFLGNDEFKKREYKDVFQADSLPKPGEMLPYPNYKVNSWSPRLTFVLPMLMPCYKFDVSNIIYYIYTDFSNKVYGIETFDGKFISKERFTIDFKFSDIGTINNDDIIIIAKDGFALKLCDGWYAKFPDTIENDKKKITSFFRGEAYTLPEPEKPYWLKRIFFPFWKK